MAKRMDEIGKSYLRKQVDDPEVRDKLTPRYAVGCKRPGFHNTYLSTFNRDNVELVTEPIDKITGSGVATTDGETHDIDVLILATGFKVMDTDDMPTYPRHRIGRPTLEPVLGREPAAVLRRGQRAGLPELLHGVRAVRLRRVSYFALIETQTHHIVRCLKQARTQARQPRRGEAARPTTATSPR